MVVPPNVVAHFAAFSFFSPVSRIIICVIQSVPAATKFADRCDVVTPPLYDGGKFVVDSFQRGHANIVLDKARDSVKRNVATLA